MKEDRLDSWMKEVIREEAEKIPVPDQKSDILRACKEADTMKRFSIKKTVGIAAVLCILCAGSVLAGGKVVSLRGGSSPANEITSYKKVADMEEKAGVDGRVMKDFQNGYTFSSANLSKVKGVDKKNNVVMTYNQLQLDYEKEDKTVILYMMPANKVTKDKTKKANKTTYKNMMLKSSTDNYKFVPEDYKQTKEDKIRVENGDLYISVGTDEIENGVYAYVSWTEEDTHYTLSSMDGEEEDGLIEMAKDMIDNGK